MKDTNSPSVRSIVGGLRPSQLWSLVSAVVAVTLGAFGVGVFSEKTRSETALLGKDTEIARLEGRVSDLEQAVAAADSRLDEVRVESVMLDTKAEFLSRYVSYLLAPTGVTERLFADYVCAMWKETQERQLRFDRESVLANDLPRPRVSRRPRRDLLGEVQITKSVTFFDGTTYEIPQAVAVDVHTRRDCVPL